MYSFHPFGGLSSHPYGGSISGPLDIVFNATTSAGKSAAKSQLDKARQKVANKIAPKTSSSAKVGTGASPTAAKQATAGLKSAFTMLDSLKNLKAPTPKSTMTLTSKGALNPALAQQLRAATWVTQDLIAQQEAEMAMMGAGGMEEEGFFSKYKNFIIIGGAVAVVGVAAFFMRRK